MFSMQYFTQIALRNVSKYLDRTFDDIKIYFYEKFSLSQSFSAILGDKIKVIVQLQFETSPQKKSQISFPVNFTIEVRKKKKKKRKEKCNQEDIIFLSFFLRFILFELFFIFR